MAKRIERSRIDAGKVDLPKKLAFLTTEKVDYHSVTDRDGEYTIEVPAAALAKLIKGRGELKSFKADQKKATKAQDEALAQEQEAHEGTKAELAKALRKVQSLTKKLEAGNSATPATTEPAAKLAGKSAAAKKPSKPAPANANSGLPVEPHAEPVAPPKVSPKNPVAEALDAATKAADEPQAPPAA